MIYQAAGCTDQGAVRRSNQDSYILKVAQLGGMQAALAVVCDGLGGLAQGELASAEMVRGFGAWFHSQLPGLMRSGLDGRALSAQWNGIVQEVHSRLRAYGERNGLMLGTTVTAALAAGGTCYLLHAGDCRAYLLYGGQEFRQPTAYTASVCRRGRGIARVFLRAASGGMCNPPVLGRLLPRNPAGGAGMGRFAAVPRRADTGGAAGSGTDVPPPRGRG